jgi:hypothetical protein
MPTPPAPPKLVPPKPPSLEPAPQKAASPKPAPTPRKESPPKLKPATPALPEHASAAGPVGHHEQLADTTLENDPRGGYRFHDPADQAYFGADSDGSRPPPPVPEDPPTEAKEQDPRRLGFAGDAQFPPQSYPRSGTQATWDDSLEPDPRHPGPGAPYLEDEASGGPTKPPPTRERT